MASESKPSNKQPAPQGGMVPQKPKPPITGHPGPRDPSINPFAKGRPTHPTGGGGSTANKKPTP